ncbi:MAG: hypothetical protein QNJ46_34025 [Leptolyngbyaceae cyanobacterium MO_188.B28]|nr:hypothetical protein [Leptolyngbyaceae cyanobacterium MO_188.B28]
MQLLTIGLLGGALILYLSSLNWRRSVKTALIIALLEGALRKWMFPQASELIYFLKDFILVGAYINYFYIYKRKYKKQPLSRYQFITILICFAAIWCVFQAFNPSLGSPIIGLFGLKNYLLYIPLIWIVPFLFDSEESLYRFLRAYLLTLIPIGLLAIAQYLSPSSSPLNVYVQDHSTGIAQFGEAVRVTGTFSYIAGYTTYLLVCFTLLLSQLTRKQSSLWFGLTLVELCLIVVTSIMTGSRGLLIAFALILIGYFGVLGVTNVSNLSRSIQKVLIPMLLVMGLAIFRFGAAIEALWSRGGNSQDVLPRIANSFTQVSHFFQYKLLDGYGTGATFQANSAIRQLFHLPRGEIIPVGYESEMGRIALDLGPIGFFIWYGLKLALVFALWKTYRKLKRPFLQQLALLSFWLQSVTFTNQLVYNHTAGLYHWFIFGFIFLLPRLEQLQNWQVFYQLQVNNQASTFPGSHQA